MRTVKAEVPRAGKVPGVVVVKCLPFALFLCWSFIGTIDVITAYIVRWKIFLCIKMLGDSLPSLKAGTMEYI